MKSGEEFDHYYRQELEQKVRDLENKRLAISKRFSYKRYGRSLLWLLALDITIGICVSNKVIPEGFIGIIPGSFVYALFAPLFILYKRNVSFEPINAEYKQSIIPRIVSFVDPQLIYKPKEGITEREFNTSDLFARPTSSFKSEDLVEGVVDGYAVRLSDVEARKRSSSNGKSAKSSNSTSSTIMTGLYAVIKMNRTVPSKVMIRQSNVINHAVNQFAEQLLGSTMVEAIRENRHEKVVKTGQADFDKDFEILCADEAVALQVVHPMFRQMLLAIKAEVGSFTFVNVALFDDQLHVAYNGTNLFEGDAHQSFIEKNISKKYFFFLTSVVGIAKVLG